MIEKLTGSNYSNQLGPKIKIKYFSNYKTGWYTTVSFENREPNIQSRTIFSSFSKCRTAGRHAGDHHGSPFPNRVFSVDTSQNIYRRILLTVNSLFTQSLQFINCFYLAKLKYFSLQSSQKDDFSIFRNHFSH